MTAKPDIRNRLLATRLPALPEVLMKVMHACADDDIGMDALADLVLQDAALAAKVLQVAASPAYRTGTPVPSVPQALATIGLDMVRTLLMTQSVYQTFHDIGAGLDLRAFWVHAMTAGVTARMLAERQGYPFPEEAYLAGLLHDIGRLALACAAPEEYSANFFADEDPALCALEERTLSITHAEAGAMLAERMALDSFLADSIRYHHVALARLKDAHALVRIVAATDCLLHLQDALPQYRDKSLALAGLPHGEFIELRARAGHEVSRLADSLGIALPGLAPAQAITRAVAAATRPERAGDPLKDTMRDVLLIDKTLSALRQQADPESCIRAIVKAAIILFDLTDAVVMERSPDGQSFVPTALPPGHQRLAGMSLPADNDNLAGRAWRLGQPAVLYPAPGPSVAEEQLLRFFNAEALIALPVRGVDARPLVLVGATSRLQAEHLAERLALLQDFGGQAGAALAGAASAVAQAGAPQTGAAQEQEYLLAARRVAHEVNNPLAIIRNYLGVLQRKAGNAQSIDSELETIEEELDRVSRIIDDFAQPEAAQPGLAGPAVCEVNAALKYVSALFSESGTLPAGVQISRQLSPEPTQAVIHQASLRQVLINLVKNAVEAMPHGGRIDLRNNGVVDRDDGRYVLLTVSDTGPGIPDTVRARLFQPVASSKDGSNRGLGLSIVHDLVRNHGGRIDCRSSRGGTVFDILLQSGGAAVVAAAPPSR
ncbi:HDOD domain-containing protein [Noviherbaspirillum galbum]|uniref:histidine kinase n=1 Tax=Noviherbaspirillum galbum TaxID=2709383 RepID=A0A6B3SLL3_9BURK|nr:HDOD domain-containing protein [Noviherbaspirillum galbum]NEX59526.1 HDOD domain-containing protein [Noviherbaspirillum galbum]